jgi:hypothetical protein
MRLRTRRFAPGSNVPAHPSARSTPSSAAQAVARKLTLVSNNEREFKPIVGLRLENWASV